MRWTVVNHGFKKWYHLYGFHINTDYHDSTRENVFGLS